VSAGVLDQPINPQVVQADRTRSSLQHRHSAGDLAQRDRAAAPSSPLPLPDSAVDPLPLSGGKGSAITRNGRPTLAGGGAVSFSRGLCLRKGLRLRRPRPRARYARRGRRATQGLSKTRRGRLVLQGGEATTAASRRGEKQPQPRSAATNAHFSRRLFADQLCSTASASSPSASSAAIQAEFFLCTCARPSAARPNNKFTAER